MEIITRAAAHAAGSKHFFTGRLCKNGHSSLRYVTTGNCVACQNSYSAKFRRENAGLTTIPAQNVHPEDVEEILKTIDFYNARRGLPLAIRAGAAYRAPNPWEQYLQKEMSIPATSRPPLMEIERAGRARGLTVAYDSMPRPIDTWGRAAITLAPRADVVARIAASLEVDGDERPS